MKLQILKFVLKVALIVSLFFLAQRGGKFDGYVQGCTDIAQKVARLGGFPTDEKDMKEFCTNKAKEALQ